MIVVQLTSTIQSTHAQTRWTKGVDITYNPDGSPLSRESVAAAIRYASASWTERSGLDLNFVGYRNVQGGSSSDGITVKWISMQAMAQELDSGFTPAATRRWFYLSSGEMAGADIYLNAAFFSEENQECFLRTMVHEVGHAIGVGTHLEERQSIMYADWDDCRYSLAAEDVEAAPYEHNICHAELTLDNDIFVPVVNLRGISYSGNLVYDGESWTLDINSFRQIPSRPECRSVRLSGTDLIFNKLWSPEQSWYAELEHSQGDSWRLRQASPR